MPEIRPAFAAFALALFATASAAQANVLPDGVVYSANEGDGSISAIHLSTGKVLTSGIPVLPHNVQITPGGKALLVVGAPATPGSAHGGHGGKGDDAHANKPDANTQAALLVLDTANLDKVMDKLPSGDHPAHVVASLDGRYAYVTNSEANQVSIIDMQQKKQAGAIPTGGYPHGLRLSADGRKLYVANLTGNSVSVIDTQARKESQRITVGKAPVQVGLTPDGKQVYVSLRDENRVAVIDTATEQVTARIDVGRNPIQLYAAGKLMYVANQGSAGNPDNTVSVIDTGSQRVISTVVTGKGAHGTVASADGAFVFVTNSVDNTVSAIDTRTQTVVGTYPVGPNPNGITYRDNP